MYELNFHPFVGESYHIQTPRVLVVGESHYSGEGDHLGKAFTNYVVRRYAKRESGERRRFFTIIAKALDVQLNNETAPTLWGRVAFYNFVQVFVGKGPRIRPTNEMFTNSNKAFKEVLEQLHPDIIVILGRCLCKHIGNYKGDFGASFSSAIVCNWTHPSTPKYFKIQQAIESLEIAKRQYNLK